jgi:hypothetical protein
MKVLLLIKAKLMIVIFILFYLSIFVSVWKVTAEMRRRVAASDKATNQIMNWHVQIAMELPVTLMNHWTHLGHNNPMELLRTCAIESKLQN